jgi:predicted GTPase
MDPIRTIIMGAAGRDFHNFNVLYRDRPQYNVVAFTATQIPNIDGRRYPASLAGDLYPGGIPIHPESELEALIHSQKVDEVVFSYSDVPYNYVMDRCSLVNAVRHPMPYGDLARQKVQRFATLADLEKHKCTIEEIEEYEPHIANGTIVYAGVDYGAILAQAQAEADVVLWDGGNNDTSFYAPDLTIVVADPLRVGNELTYYPGETNLRLADIVIINKVDSADLAAINALRANIRKVNHRAQIIEAASPIVVDRPSLIAGKRALVVEDGPTLTHGEMKFGAGTVAALKFGASEIIDPRPYTVGTITETFRKYPNMGHLLPAMGYGDEQVKDLEATIAKVPCDVVIIGTPIDLNRLVTIKQPSVRVRYDLQEIGKPDLADVLTAKFEMTPAGRVI